MGKILLLSKYSRKGASSRLRTHQYLPHLNNDGIDITISALFNDDYLRQLYDNGVVGKLLIVKAYIRRFITLLTVFRYDALWIEKELFPYFPAIFEKLLFLLGVNYIADYDDAIFHNYDLSENKAIRKFLSGKIDSVMKHAAVTVAGNDYLAERAKNAGCKNIKVIPTVVDSSRYSKSLYPDRKSTIGWIGSPSTQKYVVELLPAFKALKNKLDFKLILVGATESVVKQLKGIEVDVIHWSENSEVESILAMDVGIMPLHDGPWEKGKCGYKLIQYMACGIPVIASDVGVNAEVVNKHGSGLVVNSVDEWVDNLHKLLSSPSLKREFGQNGITSVNEYYSLQVQQDLMSTTIKSVV
ncbi:glycosyltransferase family 4 protein [Vibrio splendidus]|uniref:glycosyltransferase family 4 protein n=1 Tax=Vibrio splendidus TaxID=29497 RepID=UPI001FB388D1|nr:glycosyltransferase family 4 protein [Vibrio splendidus]UOE80913.1 glycosyltransferase family 4 protein [Vibrio splendidus]